MGRTSKNIKLRIPEKPRKIKGFRSGSYRVATTISSRSRYGHFDTSPRQPTQTNPVGVKVYSTIRRQDSQQKFEPRSRRFLHSPLSAR